MAIVVLLLIHMHTGWMRISYTVGEERETEQNTGYLLLDVIG